jgi:hypothetical protein
MIVGAHTQSWSPMGQFAPTANALPPMMDERVDASLLETPHARLAL